MQRVGVSIADDLNSDDVRHLRRRIRETLDEIEGIETVLGRLEEWRGLTAASGSAPIVERMTRLGVSKSLIEHVDEILAAISH